METPYFSRRRHRLAGLLACTPLLLGLAASARAGTPTLTTASGGPGFTRIPFVFTLDTRLGYDDNTLAEPDNFRFVQNNRVRTRGKSESVFFNANASIAYSARNSRSSLTLAANTGFTYYFDRPGRQYDPNLGLSVAFTYKLSPRATLNLSNFSTYQAEPDFGIVGGQERRNSDFFYTSNRFALAYRWAPRFSTVSSYDPAFFVFRQEPYSFYQDRAEHYFSQEFRFLVQPRLTLLGEYRFGYISYFNDRDASVVSVAGLPYLLNDFHSDSYNHFALLGIEYALGPRFQLGLRAGAQFRSYADDETFSVVNPDPFRSAFTTDRGVNRFTPIGANSRIVSTSRGSEVSPYVEGTLSYSVSRRANLTLSTRYGIEEANLATSNSSRDSYRIGVNYNQGITARLSSYAGFNYTHSEYNNTLDQNDFSENVYDLAVGLRYALNRHVGLEIGYSHTTVDSNFSNSGALNGGTQTANDFNGRDYDRNRYFIGARFAF